MHQQCSAKPQEKQKQPAVAKKTPNVESASQSSSSSHQLIPVIEGIVFPANSTNGEAPPNLDLQNNTVLLT